jgi:hypothetical protein
MVPYLPCIEGKGGGAPSKLDCDVVGGFSLVAVVEERAGVCTPRVLGVVSMYVHTENE